MTGLQRSCIIEAILCIVLLTVDGEQVLVKYQKENYIVTGGCPSGDPAVQKWRQFCSILHRNTTVCVTERFGRRLLTVPRFSNLCDALCHVPMSPKMTSCPHKKGDTGKPFSIKHHGGHSRPGTKRMILNFRNSEYVTRGGCPSRDPVVQRFYSLCMSSFGKRAVCRSDRLPGTILVYPVYTDVCSALCHTNKLGRNLKFCPGGARVVGVSPV